MTPSRPPPSGRWSPRSRRGPPSRPARRRPRPLATLPALLPDSNSPRPRRRSSSSPAAGTPRTTSAQQLRSAPPDPAGYRPRRLLPATCFRIRPARPAGREDPGVEHVVQADTGGRAVRPPSPPRREQPTRLKGPTGRVSRVRVRAVAAGPAVAPPPDAPVAPPGPVVRPVRRRVPVTAVPDRLEASSAAASPRPPRSTRLWPRRSRPSAAAEVRRVGYLRRRHECAIARGRRS